MNTNRPPFDPSTWQYENAAAEREELLARLSKHLDHETIARLRAETHFGGKAFGLAIAQEVAKRSTGNGISITVPPWAGFSPLPPTKVPSGIINRFRAWRRSSKPAEPTIASTIKHATFPRIIRSSGLTEDWGSGESGEHTSFPPRERASFEELLEKFSADHSKMPYVIQEYYPGIGIVVDIAWSQLLGRPVARIAWGRAIYDVFGNRNFSSATWDYEGPQGLMCCTTSQMLVPLTSAQPPDCEPEYSATLLHTLYTSLKSLDLTFGVQLELIVHPSRPGRFHLVQIRPSPTMVRPNDEATYPPRAGRCVLTTPSVSGAFDVHGPVRVIERTESEHTYGAVIRQAKEAGKAPEAYVGGHIVIWADSPHKYGAEEDIAQIHGLGALAQIGPVMSNNTSHEAPRQQPLKRRKEARNIHAIAHTMATNYPPLLEHHDWLTREILPHACDELRVISDGLVGQIYITKDKPTAS